MLTEKSWTDLNESKDDAITKMLHQNKWQQHASKNPLQKMKKNLLYNIVYGIIVCFIYIGIILYFNSWQVRLAIFVVLIFSLWAVFTAYQQYKSIDSNVSPHHSLLHEMKRHYHSLNEWMRVQQKVALFIYPVSAAGGFMLGGMLGSGKSVDEFLGKPVIIIALIISIAVLVPVCYFGAKWLFQFSFGKHLKTLAEHIDEMESLK